MPAKGSTPKFRNSYYVKGYQLAASGLSDTEIAQALGVNKGTLKAWKKSNKDFAESIAKGRSTHNPDSKGTSFLDYVYGRLPKKIRRLWNELQLAETCKNPEKKIELLLADKGRRTRQWLFIHSLVVANFHLPEALRMSYTSDATFDRWKRDDPDFLDMVARLHTLKKEWAEGCLFGLVAQGDTTATIFLNRSLNPEKGYNPKITVVNTGQITHGHINIEKMLEKLSTDAKRELAQGFIPNGDNPVPQLAPRKVIVSDEE